MKEQPKTITSDAEATRLFVGRTIKSVHLDLVQEDDGSISSGQPCITLDDDTMITFNVQDYGSGTYGIDLQTIRRSRQKGKRVSP